MLHCVASFAQVGNTRPYLSKCSGIPIKATQKCSGLTCLVYSAVLPDPHQSSAHISYFNKGIQIQQYSNATILNANDRHRLYRTTTANSSAAKEINIMQTYLSNINYIASWS